MTYTIILTLSLLALYHFSTPGLVVKKRFGSLLMKDIHPLVNFFMKLALCPGCLCFWLGGAVALWGELMHPVIGVMIISSAIVHLAMALYYEFQR